MLMKTEKNKHLTPIADPWSISLILQNVRHEFQKKVLQKQKKKMLKTETSFHNSKTGSETESKVLKHTLYKSTSIFWKNNAKLYNIYFVSHKNLYVLKT